MERVSGTAARASSGLGLVVASTRTVEVTVHPAAPMVVEACVRARVIVEVDDAVEVRITIIRVFHEQRGRVDALTIEGRLVSPDRFELAGFQQRQRRASTWIVSRERAGEPVARE